MPRLENGVFSDVSKDMFPKGQGGVFNGVRVCEGGLVRSAAKFSFHQPAQQCVAVAVPLIEVGVLAFVHMYTRVGQDVHQLSQRGFQSG